MILQGVEFPIFLFIFEWALQQCSANALPVIKICMVDWMWWYRLNAQNWQEWLNLLIWRGQHCWCLTVPVMHRHQAAVQTLMILQQILHAAVIHVRKLISLW